MNLTTITDFENPALDMFARYSENQLAHFYEPKGGLFLAESPNVIERALQAGYEPVSVLVEDKCLDTISFLLHKHPNLPVFQAPFDVLTKLTGYQLTRGAICAMKRLTLPDAKDICEKKRRIAVLEQVNNPTNIGAIFRSAAALNVDAILLSHGCSDPLYRRAARVSMGTVFQIPWTYLPTELTANGLGKSGIEFLHTLGFKTTAMALTENSRSIKDPEILAEDKLAILLGNEGNGLTTETIEYSDYTIKIPMTNGVDSLNVAAASAVSFWQLCNG